MSERRHGRSTYLKYKCRCDVCVEDARAYRAKRAVEAIRLKADPFIHRLTVDGRIDTVDRSSVARWKRNGMTIYWADRWAVSLGYHPYEIWGADFYQGCGDHE